MRREHCDNNNFIPLDYIEGNGNAATMVPCESGVPNEFEMEFSCDDVVNNQERWFFGVESSSYRKFRLGKRAGSNDLTLNCFSGNSGAYIDVNYLSTYGFATVKMKDGVITKANGETLNITPREFGAFNGFMGVGCCHIPEQSAGFMYGIMSSGWKIKHLYFKIGSTKYDLYPYKQKNTNVYGLLNILTNSFYASTTGTPFSGKEL